MELASAQDPDDVARAALSQIECYLSSEKTWCGKLEAAWPGSAFQELKQAASRTPHCVPIKSCVDALRKAEGHGKVQVQLALALDGVTTPGELFGEENHHIAAGGRLHKRRAAVVDAGAIPLLVAMLPHQFHTRLRSPDANPLG